MEREEAEEDEQFRILIVSKSSIINEPEQGTFKAYFIKDNL